MPEIRVVNVRAVRRQAEHGITQRLGHWDARSIISVERDQDHPGAVVLHVNSGGNAQAAADQLVIAGYFVQHLPKRSGEYGGRVLVMPSRGLQDTKGGAVLRRAAPRRVSPEASERALRLRQSGDLIGGEA